MSFAYNIAGVTLDDKLFGNLSNVSIANAFRNIAKHYDGVAIGAISEKVTLNSWAGKRQRYDLDRHRQYVGCRYDHDQFRCLDSKTTPTTASQFKIGSTALRTAINLTALINSYSKINIFVVASYARGTVTTTGVVTVTALGAGRRGITRGRIRDPM